ncbi:probable F420-dependent oxidoreductase, Rv2161c family [Sphingomonas laterariae]|uniref:Probable F420-dependent oxidoreductase, Rv2161c family n=1 Tax=Edaphosphingomonas laterariae TaxID=861865 RepID=A0A239I7T7_9SPHN|nr:TIGR03619 family F420-dependent LLM class oxidoreductase [Sphingomonas laterariae]SNS89599.1 probable F420-dependent oxidoreductase, Rv2161c family [Sphingomonas laterariae]
MKFWLVLMGVAEVDQLVALSQHAEECGFHGVTVADHLVMPTEFSTKYPYSQDGEWFWPIETPWPDPWVTLGVIGAQTKRIKLATNIYLAALRDPFTAARAIAAVDAFAPGRAVCGVSAGWLKEEYDAVGVDFTTRGRKLDEMIAVMRKLWTGEIVSHEGEFFNFNKILTKPSPAESIPVLCGGSALPALRRAARNDGWLGLPLDLAGNLAIVNQLLGLREEQGKSRDGFTPILSLAEPLTADAIARLDEVGGHLSAMPWLPSPWDVERFTDDGADFRQLQVKKDAISRYADRIIAKHI